MELWHMWVHLMAIVLLSNVLKLILGLTEKEAELRA